MTVTATTSRISYAGDGVTKTFTVPFYFLEAAHLVVLIRTAPNIDQQLTLTTDYAVLNAGVPVGGSVILVTAPTANQTLIIYRDPDITQYTDYQANDPFPAETHERALDKLTMIAQRLREMFNKTFRLADSYTGSVSTVIPEPEANKLIGWNDDGTGLQNVGAGELATIVAFGTANADVFTGDGVTTTFSLTGNPGVLANLDVSVGGVAQIPTENYTFSNSTITFTSAPPNGVKILVRYMQGLPQGTSDSATASFVQAGTSPVTRTAQTKMREIVTPQDYGAIGDGVANDSTPLANFESNTAGLHVYPAGKYLGANGVDNFTEGFVSGDNELTDQMAMKLDNTEGALLPQLFGTKNARTILGNPESYLANPVFMGLSQFFEMTGVEFSGDASNGGFTIPHTTGTIPTQNFEFRYGTGTSSSSAQTNVTFSSSFPNSCAFVMAVTAGYGNATLSPVTVNVFSKSQTGFSLNICGTSGRLAGTFNYIAIGR